MSNPFANWTPEMVQKHNARVAGMKNEIPIGNQRPALGTQRSSLHEPLPAVQASPASAKKYRVSICSHRVRLLDKDNLYGGAKPYCDALRYAGAIRDDTVEALELEVTQQKVQNYDQEYTTIEVTEL